MSRRNGFTLVELVVVILILGILAGVAAPKMFNTSAKATDNGLRQTLAIVRDAIELHRAQYGALPPCAAGGVNLKLALKEFLRGQFPTCPVGLQDDTVKPSTADPLVADGTANAWMYNTDTGEFICNSTAASATDGAVTYDEF